MKLDLNCLRDVLICVEDNTGLHQSCVFYDVPVMEKSCSLLGKEKPDIPGYQAELLKKYDNDTLFYHVLQCVEGGLLACLPDTAGYEAVINRLTFEGHDFLDSIRNESVLEKVKSSVTEKGGEVSFTIVKELAKFLTVAFVKTVASSQGLTF